jgi:hypothetical protein
MTQFELIVFNQAKVLYGRVEKITVQFQSIRHPLVTVTLLMKFSIHHLALGAVTGSEFHQVWLGISIF